MHSLSFGFLGHFVCFCITFAELQGNKITARIPATTGKTSTHNRATEHDRTSLCCCITYKQASKRASKIEIAAGVIASKHLRQQRQQLSRGAAWDELQDWVLHGFSMHMLGALDLVGICVCVPLTPYIRPVSAWHQRPKSQRLESRMLQ